MIVYRVGEGQTTSGLRLDVGTQWYKEDELDNAMRYALLTHRNIYRKSGNNAYRLYYDYRTDHPNNI